MPSAYRSLVQIGLHSETNLAAGFDGAEPRRQLRPNRTRYALESALIYPLVVCVLVYAGMISFVRLLRADARRDVRKPAADARAGTARAPGAPRRDALLGRSSCRSCWRCCWHGGLRCPTAR